MKLKSKRKPFQDESESWAVFISNAWVKHFELMDHLCQFSQNILLITAPELGGKTTIYQQYLQRADDKVRKIGITAGQASVESLMQSIAKALALELDDYSLAHEQVENALATAMDAKENILLLIDDAHCLSDEQLHALLTLVHFDSDDNQLHLVFIGNPSLELRLFSQEFAASVNGKIYTIELEAWTLHDVRSYIGKQQTYQKITTEQIATIYDNSRGNPGDVVREFGALLSQLNMGKKMDKRQLLQWKKNPMVLGALIGLVAGGAYLVVSQSQDDSGFAQVPINMAQNEAQMNSTNVPEPTTPTMTYHAPNMDQTDNQHQGTQPNTDSDATPESQSSSQPTTEQLPASTQATPPAHQATTANLPEPLTEPAQAQPAPADLAAAHSEGVAQQAAVEVQAQAQAPVEAPAEKADMPKAHASLSDKEQQLLKRGADRYTVQLLGARSEQSVQSFIKTHQMAGKATYFKSSLGGKDWFVLVYGDYPSAQAAKKAAQEEISDKLAGVDMKPWVREMDSVQQDIRKNNKS